MCTVGTHVRAYRGFASPVCSRRHTWWFPPQVRSLCLGGVEPAGLSPEGLLELLGAGCPGLTSLELSQCDGLVK